MHAAIKMIIGILVFLAGILWYAEGIVMDDYNIANFVVGDVTEDNTISNFDSFRIVFGGLFGGVLIVLGAIVAWIEFEDLKWERKERKEKSKK